MSSLSQGGDLPVRPGSIINLVPARGSERRTEQGPSPPRPALSPRRRASRAAAPGFCAQRAVAESPVCVKCFWERDGHGRRNRRGPFLLRSRLYGMYFTVGTAMGRTETGNDRPPRSRHMRPRLTVCKWRVSYRTREYDTPLLENQLSICLKYLIWIFH